MKGEGRIILNHEHLEGGGGGGRVLIHSSSRGGGSGNTMHGDDDVDGGGGGGSMGGAGTWMGGRERGGSPHDSRGEHKVGGNEGVCGGGGG